MPGGGWTAGVGGALRDALVAGLVADGVPIDGVGFEMHETQAGPETGVITQMADPYHALGLDVAITELDLHTYDVDQQTRIYGHVVAEALAAGIRDINFWGFTDKHAYTWLPGAKPLMLDEDSNPKPAYFFVQDALQSYVQSTSAPGTGTLSHTSRRTPGRLGLLQADLNLSTVREEQATHRSPIASASVPVGTDGRALFLLFLLAGIATSSW